jgi:hypothetical protein
MEFISGPSLAQDTGNGPLAWKRVATLGTDLADALAQSLPTPERHLHVTHQAVSDRYQQHSASEGCEAARVSWNSRCATALSRTAPGGSRRVARGNFTPGLPQIGA